MTCVLCLHLEFPMVRPLRLPSFSSYSFVLLPRVCPLLHFRLSRTRRAMVVGLYREMVRCGMGGLFVENPAFIVRLPRAVLVFVALSLCVSWYGN